jgi:hypothetical protein
MSLPKEVESNPFDFEGEDLYEWTPPETTEQNYQSTPVRHITRHCSYSYFDERVHDFLDNEFEICIDLFD